MGKKIISISLFYILTGCVSAPKMVKTTTYPDRTVTFAYDPVFDNSSPKKIAIQAEKYCGSKAVPISEEIRREVDGGIPAFAGQTSTTEFTYVTFKCE